MALHDETFDTNQDLTIYHPGNRWKYKVFKAGTYEMRDLLEPIFVKGELVYKQPTLEEIRDYSKEELKTIWDEIKRFAYPQEYYVDLTEKLLNLKMDMLDDFR